MRAVQVRLRYLILGLVAVGVPVGIAGAAPASADCVNAGPAAAELHGRRSAGVMSGASAATSAHLFTHPDVNGFFTGLRGQPKDQIRAQVQEYLDQHAQVSAEIAGIRQPSVDFRNRCG